MSNWTNDTINTVVVENESKTVVSVTNEEKNMNYLLIDDTNVLLIDDTFKLLIGGIRLATWTNETKN